VWRTGPLSDGSRGRTFKRGTRSRGSSGRTAKEDPAIKKPSLKEENWVSTDRALPYQFNIWTKEIGEKAQGKRRSPQTQEGTVPTSQATMERHNRDSGRRRAL